MQIIKATDLQFFPNRSPHSQAQAKITKGHVLILRRRLFASWHQGEHAQAQ